MIVGDAGNATIFDQQIADVGTLQDGSARVPGASQQGVIETCPFDLNRMRIATRSLIAKREAYVHAEVEAEFPAVLFHVSLGQHPVEDAQLVESDQA